MANVNLIFFASSFPQKKRRLEYTKRRIISLFANQAAFFFFATPLQACITRARAITP